MNSILRPVYNQAHCIFYLAAKVVNITDYTLGGLSVWHGGGVLQSTLAGCAGKQHKRCLIKRLDPQHLVLIVDHQAVMNSNINLRKVIRSSKGRLMSNLLMETQERLK